MLSWRVCLCDDSLANHDNRNSVSKMIIHINPDQSFDWLNALKDFLGVGLGALLAYLAASLAERRKAAAEDLAEASLLSIKFMALVDGILKIDRQIQEDIARSNELGIDGPAWTKFEGIAGISDYEINISVDELGLLARHQKFDLIISIFEIRDGYNGVVRALAQLFALKDKIPDFMPPNRLDGSVAIFDGPVPAGALPLVASLTTLGESVIESLSNLKRKAKETAPKLHAELKSALGAKKLPLVHFPGE